MKVRAMGQVTRNGAIVAALALLAGCVSLGGKTPKMLLGLTAEKTAAAGTMAGGRIDDALLVLDPQVERKLDVLRVAVQVDATRIAYLQDTAWVERPARQFRHLLAETIRARGQRLVIEANDDGLGSKNVLSGRLIDMGYDARSQSVVVRYDALREDGKGMVSTRRFEAVVPGVSPEAAAVGAALNRAANDVAGQVADWVG